MFRTGNCTVPGLGVALFACAAAWSTPAVGQSEIAAHINGKPVTIAELDAEVSKSNRKLFQQLYDARRAALDSVLINRLLAPEAEKNGTTIDALLNVKIAAKMTAVTDEEVQTFFDKNRANMRGKKLPQVSKQIRTYLAGQRKAAAKNSVIIELKRGADVKIAMGPPRSPMVMAANDPTKGPATAKVTILEFSDFQ